MAGVTSKRELQRIDGTPKKRTFMSIISDYHLRISLCELIDNALDLWKHNAKPAGLKVDITLDPSRQIIAVRDNAGGVKQKDLELLIAPGATRSEPDDEIIGTFGVGGKRAGVALGEHVEIRTHAKGSKSIQLDITNDWIESEDWELTAYEIPPIPIGTTSVEISKLRQPFTQEDVDEMREHFGETYKWFIDEGCEITLNGAPIKAISHESWAYPPGFAPRRMAFDVSPVNGRSVGVTITAGLISDRDPEGLNYGVYFYCNNRLIVKELRTRDVGYEIRSEAGVPHPDASLCRVIVELQGPSELMPWNSSKSDLNYRHPAFQQLRSRLITLTSYFSSLSRRFKSDWDGSVFVHTKGKIETVMPDAALSGAKTVLPKLPRTRKLPLIERLREANRTTLSRKPWTLGLVEALGLVDLIFKQRMDTKNRAALILLDSNFEIGLKEFIVNRTDLFPPHIWTDAKIAGTFKMRSQVIKEVQAHANFSPTLLGKVNHFYNLRNKLTHERATVGITDAQVEDYRKVVEDVLKKLFDLRFPRS